jgi:hypothetical protein
MLAALLFAAQLVAAPVGYEAAKALADANEAKLSADLHSALLESQGNALGAALASCGRPGMDLAKFTVVLRLNPDGSAAQSWRQGDTPLAKCMHAKLSASGLVGHWPQPFYTSFEVSLGGA